MVETNNSITNSITTLIVTKVSLGPCIIDDTSKADFPFTSNPLTASTSSPYQIREPKKTYVRTGGKNVGADKH